LQVIRNDYVARGFEILGIDDEAWSTQLPFNRQYSWVFLRDANNAVWAQYAQNGYIPLNYVIDPNGIVRYWGEGFDEAAVRAAIVAWLPVGVEAGGKEKPADEAAILFQNRPNPSKGSAEIAFSLPRSEQVRLAVYDAQGRLVRTLAEGNRAAGTHQVRLSGLESGVYFYRLDAGGSSLTRRMVVAK
jgi:hypothetical protein